MTRLTDILLIVCFSVVLFGCHRTKIKHAEAQPSPALPADYTERRVDPRLLEETGNRASKAEEEAGMAYHKTTKDADRFPAFLRSSTLVHGGYSVRFVTGSNSLSSVRHFFDEHGKWMRTDGRRTPY